MVTLTFLGDLMNVVVLIGTLSRDPESRDLPSGDTVTSFDVTTRESGT